MIPTNHPERPSGSPAAAAFAVATLFSLLILALAGCSKPAAKVDEVRPVRALRLSAEPGEVVAEFPGDVRPRVESRLGFRVGGKIIGRRVNVGDAVVRDQVLMQLDPQDLRLAQMQANAALDAARSNYGLARSELQRYQDLRNRNFVSQAALDAKLSAYQAARASFDQAVATYASQRNQTGYATLSADGDGVVTAVDAEVGQVVSAGTAVVRVAQAADKEVIVAIPEDQVDRLRRVADIRVRLWANPQASIHGSLRELSPMADPASRTFTAKISIPAATPGVRLGMTASVVFAAASSGTTVTAPLSALLRDSGGGSAVWVVENGAVRLVPVQLGVPSGDGVVLAAGVDAGQTIVTAGVNSLHPGQKVRILGAEATLAPNLPPTPPPPALHASWLRLTSTLGGSNGRTGAGNGRTGAGNGRTGTSTDLATAPSRDTDADFRARTGAGSDQ